MSSKVYIRQYGNTLELSGGNDQPLSKELMTYISPHLCFQKKIYLTPYQRRMANTRTKFSFETVCIYDVDEKGRLCTCAGFLNRITRTFNERGVTVLYKDVSPKPNPKTFSPYLHLVDNKFTFRPRQKECLEKILRNRSGIINAPTAFGKGAMICMVALALPYARIFVTTRRVAVVETLCERLSKIFPNVGQIGGGVSRMGERITVVSGDSLHRVTGEVDVLLVDEVHEYGADTYSSELAKFKHTRMYGFSASPKGRFDGTDLRIEALFGPQIFHMTYQEAVELGLVVPIRVDWLDVPMDINPVEGCTNDVLRKRIAIWTNDERNDIIAEKAKAYPNQQVLILVDTLEHAVNLKKRLPDFSVVYATAEESDLRKYRRDGLIDESFPVLNKKKRKELKEQYERGELKHVIATGVWAVGVDFTFLEVLIRADGGASEIASIQVPGRVSRINDNIEKDVGVLVDFRDRFDEGFAKKAKIRQGYYRDMGWEQVMAD